MKRVIGVLALCCFLFGPAAYAQNREAPLTNAAVVKLVKAGFKEKTIVLMIAARQPNFDLSPDRLIELKRSGVSENIIIAMLSRQEGIEADVDDDSWGDEQFFGRSPNATGNSG